MTGPIDIDPDPATGEVPDVVGPGSGRTLYDVDIPHFSLPFRRDTHGRCVVNEQDSDAEILDCVEVLLATERGSRMEVPEYGVPDQVFRQGGADLNAISSAIARWEPRADHFVRREQELIDMTDRIRVSVMERDHG